MTHIEESTEIKGVYIVKLRAFEDPRGRFTETFRKEWFPQRQWDSVQTNRSDSKAGVVRGLHYHFKQVDYWHILRGEIRAGLVDIRPDSPTFRQTQVVPMGGENHIGLFIPVGVAHGFSALTEVTLTYVVDNYFDNTDEHGIAWDDPDLNIDWGLTNPIVSPRDQTNPHLRDVPLDSLPKLNS